MKINTTKIEKIKAEADLREQKGATQKELLNALKSKIPVA